MTHINPTLTVITRMYIVELLHSKNETGEMNYFNE